MNNGNGNGGGLKRLERLLSHHEQVAAALRTTLTLLRGHSVASSQQRAGATLDGALAIERARRAHRRIPKKSGGGGGKKHSKNSRAKTFRLLGKFSPTEPRPAVGLGRSGTGVLVTHGYLAKKGDGYIRTSKPFEVRR